MEVILDEMHQKDPGAKVKLTSRLYQPCCKLQYKYACGLYFKVLGLFSALLCHERIQSRPRMTGHLGASLRAITPVETLDGMHENDLGTKTPHVYHSCCQTLNLLVDPISKFLIPFSAHPELPVLRYVNVECE